MCQAIREMMEDSRQEGIAEGETRGEIKGSAGQIIEIIDNIKKELHCSLEKACIVGGKTQAEYQQAKAICRKS